jgi:NTP pyrophosphatase (non-canonical NTP hydrolase)
VSAVYDEADPLTSALDLCDGGHPFEPGVDADEPANPSDPWCNICGASRLVVAGRVTTFGPRIVATDRDPASLPERQALAMADEGGEFVHAFRRWRGSSRTPGTFAEVAEELADVWITAIVTAHVLGIDLAEAVRAKSLVIDARLPQLPTADVTP